MKKLISLIFGSALVMFLVAPSTARANDAFAKKILELHPEADTNGDGVLSSAEAAAQTRKILDKFPKLDTENEPVGALLADGSVERWPSTRLVSDMPLTNTTFRT